MQLSSIIANNHNINDKKSEILDVKSLVQQFKASNLSQQPRISTGSQQQQIKPTISSSSQHTATIATTNKNVFQPLSISSSSSSNSLSSTGMLLTNESVSASQHLQQRLGPHENKGVTISSFGTEDVHWIVSHLDDINEKLSTLLKHKIPSKMPASEEGNVIEINVNAIKNIQDLVLKMDQLLKSVDVLSEIVCSDHPNRLESQLPLDDNAGVSELKTMFVGMKGEIHMIHDLIGSELKDFKRKLNEMDENQQAFERRMKVKLDIVQENIVLTRNTKNPEEGQQIMDKHGTYDDSSRSTLCFVSAANIHDGGGKKVFGCNNEDLVGHTDNKELNELKEAMIGLLHDKNAVEGHRIGYQHPSDKDQQNMTTLKMLVDSDNDIVKNNEEQHADAQDESGWLFQDQIDSQETTM